MIWVSVFDPWPLRYLRCVSKVSNFFSALVEATNRSSFPRFQIHTQKYILLVFGCCVAARCGQEVSYYSLSDNYRKYPTSFSSQRKKIDSLHERMTVVNVRHSCTGVRIRRCDRESMAQLITPNEILRSSNRPNQIPTNKILPSRTMLAHTSTSESHWMHAIEHIGINTLNACVRERALIHVYFGRWNECVARLSRWIYMLLRLRRSQKRRKAKANRLTAHARHTQHRRSVDRHCCCEHNVFRYITSIQLYVRVRALRAYAFLYSFFFGLFFVCRFWVVRLLFGIQFSSLETDIDGYERKTVQDKTSKSQKRNRK